MTVAVGFFDGVHLGHQAILKGADCALTFENHPLEFLDPARAPRLIMSWEDRARAIMALGVRVTALDFDADLAGWPPERFLAFLADFAACQGRRAPEPLAVRCGANWRFGRGGAGDAAWLRRQGVDVTVVPYAHYRGEPVSSTRVRRALAAGAVADAAAMLGRPYVVRGRTVAGKGLGRTLGFPTVNLVPDGDPARFVAPPLGVYAVELDGVRGVANYGCAPTLGERAWPVPVWEVHFLDPADPGARVRRDSERLAFSVRRFIRPERKFASLDELKAQIAADAREAARA